MHALSLELASLASIAIKYIHEPCIPYTNKVWQHSVLKSSEKTKFQVQVHICLTDLQTEIG